MEFEYEMGPAQAIHDPLDPTGVLGELSEILRSAQTLEKVTEDVVGLAKARIPGADEVSMTLITRGRPSTIASTGRLATELDERQYDAGWGPCLDATAAGESLIVQDSTAETRWPAFIRRAVEVGVGATMSMPLPLQQETVGGLNVYSCTPRAFDASSVALARSFANHAALAVSHAHRYADIAQQATQLQEAMSSRAIIEQAKGMMMAIRRCDQVEAFEVLVHRSQREQVKLRQLAANIVTEVSGHPLNPGGS